MQKNTFAFFTFLVCIFFSFTSHAQTWYWAKQADSSSSQNASVVAVDKNNNPCYTGDFTGTRMAFGNSIGLSNSATQSDFLVKYDGNGNPLWARNGKALNTSAAIQGNSVATDGNNNIVETGSFTDTVSFGLTALYSNGSNENSYLVKYDLNGNVVWATSPTITKSFSSQNDASGVAIDKANNTYVTGVYIDTVVFGNDTLSSNGQDSYLVKYDENGNVLWAFTPVNSSTVLGMSVVTDDSNNIFISGEYSSAITFGTITLPSPPLSSPPDIYIYISKFDSAGNIKWAIGIPAIQGTGPTPLPIATDKLGDVYVGAQFTNPSLTIGPSTITDDGLPNSNSMLAKYDRNGNPIWAVCADFISVDEVMTIIESSIAVDGCDNIYWSGFCSDTFGVAKMKVTVPGGGTHPNRAFSYIMKLDSAGNPIAAAAMNNQADAQFSNGLAVDSLSKVYYVGNLTNPATLIIGSDTVFRYQSNQTCFISKFAVFPNIANSKTNDTICRGDSIILSVPKSPGITYEWSTGATNDSITVKPTSTATYFVKVNNCITDTSTIKVTVLTPGVPTITGKDSICQGDSTLLTAGNGVNYKWSTGKTTTTIYVLPPIATTYTLKASSGQCADSVTKKVSPIAYPVAAVSGTSWKCPGLVDTLRVSGGITYVWNNGNTTTTYYTGAINGDSSMRVIAYNLIGCPDTVKFTVTERNPPTLTITPPALACSGNPVPLRVSATGTSPFTYKWEPGGENTSEISVTPTVVTIYTATVTNGCLNFATTTVTPGNPQLTACCDKTIIQGDDTLITAYGSNLKSYKWTPAAGLSCDTCPTITVTPTATTTYTITGTDSVGCTIERQITITVESPCADFTVPNVFTPNYSGPYGENNALYIHPAHVTAWSIFIYDRWGKEIFKSTSASQYWNGLTESGGQAPDGVYYYLINATCQNNSYKKEGFIQLIR